MKNKRLFAAFFLLAATPLAAQSCLEIAIQKGQTAYNQGKYTQARQFWEAGKDCENTNVSRLNDLIWKTRDADSDGIVNGRDGCPNEPGPSSNNGCPDRDADGVADKDDTCPDVPGIKENKGCPEEKMVLVKGGTFTMGDLFGDGNETQHPVTLSDFYIGKTEVTFEEYDAFCNATGRTKPDDEGWGRGKRPVINVSWHDAVEYCNWLSQREKRTPAYTVSGSSVTLNEQANGYRLPTEAEWEYAAREGGKKVRFGNGKDKANSSEINFDAKNGSEVYADKGEYRQKTVEVGSLRSPNTLGLHDMSGNVWEWCWDWYGEYPKNSQTNPTGPASGATRVLRGGSWNSYPQYCRAAYRNSNTPTARHADLGFRVAASFQ